MSNGDILTSIEEKGGFLIFVVVLLSMAVIVTSSLRNPVDFDVWWHLKMGTDWIEQGLSPWVDHYSYSALGEEIKNPPVVFQVILYGLSELFGERGGQVAIKLLGFAAVLGLFLLWLRQLRAPALVYLLLFPLLVSALQMRMQIRPELISYSLTVLAFMLYHRSQLRLTFGAMMPIVLLLLFWVNYHVPLYGYVIFFGLFVDIAVRLLKEKARLREWLIWLGWGLLVFSVGFINPSGKHFFIELLLLPSEWVSFTLEYQAPVQMLKLLVTYLWIACLIITIIMALKMQRFGYLIILGVFAYGAVSMSRMVAPAVLVNLLIFANLLCSEKTRNALKAWPDKRKKIFAVGIGIVCVVTIVHNVLLARYFLEENRRSAEILPDATVAYIRTTGLQGNVFNIFRTGGFLAYHLAPDIKIFMDGRTGILYGIDMYDRYQAAMSSTEDFLSEMDRTGTDMALLPNNDNTRNLMRDAGFGLEFSDIKYSLFKRDDAAMVNIGRLEAKPYCWSLSSSTKFQRESVAAARTVPPNANAIALLALANEYERASDKSAALRNRPLSTLTSDPSKRYYAITAFNEGLYVQSVQALNLVRDWQAKDVLLRILALHRSGNIPDAQRELDRALKTLRNWRNVTESDFIILRAVIDELSGDSLLPFVNPELDRELTDQVGGRSLRAQNRNLRAGDFCAIEEG